ncbi:MAG: hypothetical protein KC501_02530 [Myxococcales bacterium]|nr:hypothetical protein [Myxococcales bacterium]
MALRFATLYFALYALPFPLDVPPGGELLAGLYRSAWDAVVPWVGNTLLGIDYEIAVGPNGSGDTTADYVKLVMMLGLALLGTGLWSALDRRASCPRLAAWLTVWARYWLGTVMVAYGFAKVFCLQFPFPDTIRLTDAYGESSPMGLLWTFMGYSPGYNVFTGGVEVLGGLLLLWRRTTTLGALVTVGAMTNVVMLNFCYDVPVKLFSSHLLVVASLLAAQDAKRLLGVLVLGRAVPAREVSPVLDGPRSRRLRRPLKVLFLGLLLLTHVGMSMQAWSSYGPGAPPPPLYGAYEVSEHERDGGEAPVLQTDESRWVQLAFGRWGRVRVHTLGGEARSYMAEIDEEAGTLVLTSRPAAGEDLTTHVLTFERPEEGTLVIAGTIDGVRHRVVLQRRDEEQMLLVRRGFHWINELPHNR